MSNERKRFAETYGGIVGAAMPMVAMLGGILVLAAMGMRSTKNFWSAGYLAVLVGFLVYKDKKEFQKALIDGIRDNIFAFMIACFLLAGVMSKILTASHLVDGLLYLMSKINMSPAFMPIVCFAICVVLSSATGSAAGAMNTAAPVMIPLAVGMGCNVNLICGALLAGSCFGDNLAPISDTTIASSLSQEVDVMKVVKSRLKYAVIAGGAASVGYIVFGFMSSGSGVADKLAADATYASSLIFLIIPILVIILMLRGTGLFTSLLVSEMVGIVMLFAFGYIDFAGLVAADGLIANAFNGMIGSIIFILFIFVMVSLISHAGVLDAILKFMQSKAKSDLSAEVAAGAMVSIVGIAISSGTSAITFCGPIIRSLLRLFKIDRARAANLLDGLGCGVGYLVPTNPGCLNLAAIAVASGVVAEGYNAISFVGYNFHSMALFVVFWFAILTGWGRKHETDAELAADGIVIDEV
ncbi:Na+/H+ antiporter NhaC family protein [Eubacterium sp.]|uniref:Na+/H+ antiporter NhaC family protein n=1 Tax=Eubacterium sp. TaxID=142586 RepID=UPI003AB71C64